MKVASTAPVNSVKECGIGASVNSVLLSVEAGPQIEVVVQEGESSLTFDTLVSGSEKPAA